MCVTVNVIMPVAVAAVSSCKAMVRINGSTSVKIYCAYFFREYLIAAPLDSSP